MKKSKNTPLRLTEIFDTITPKSNEELRLMSHNACYSNIKTTEIISNHKDKNNMSTQKLKSVIRPLSCLAVPLDFNTAANLYPFEIFLISDTSRISVEFYECNGLYWYSLSMGKIFAANSTSFISVVNCISAFRAFIREIGFRFEDETIAENRLCDLRLMSASKSSPKSSEV